MDQYDFARRIEALRAGPPPLPMKQVAARELAQRLDDLVNNETYRAGAAAIAAEMAREPGVAGAVKEIEEAVADLSGGVTCRRRAKVTPSANIKPLSHVAAIMAHVMTAIMMHPRASVAHCSRGRRILHARIGAGSGPNLRVLRLRAADREKRAETRRSQTNHQFFHSVILRVS